MNSLLKQFLSPQYKPYLVINSSYIILEIPPYFNDSFPLQNQIEIGHDVRNFIPELIGYESTLAEVFLEEKEKFNLQGVVRNSSSQKIHYFDIKIVADIDKKQEERNLYIFFEDVTKEWNLKQSLVQSSNETYLLLEELEAAKDYIEKVIISMTEALFVVTESGKIKTVNLTARKLFGYQEEELIDQDFAKIAPNYKLYFQNHQFPLIIQNFNDVDITCYKKTGESIPISFSCSHIKINRVENAQVYVGRDITERKRYETEIKELNDQLTQKVEESTLELRKTIQRLEQEIIDRQQAEQEVTLAKEQLQAVLDAVPGFVSWVTQVQNSNPDQTSQDNVSELQYLGVNQKLADNFQLSPQDFIGCPVGFLGNTYPFAQFMYDFMALSDKSISRILEFTNKNQNYYYLIVAQKYQQGNVAVSIGIDITERKQAEEALRASEQKFRAIFDQSFQITGLLQPDGIVIEVNQTALDFGGLTIDEVVHKPLWEAPWWRISQEIQNSLKQAIAQAALGNFIRYEVDNINTGNKIVTLDFSIKPVKNEENQVILLIAEGRDISERKLAEQQIKWQNQRSQLLSEITLKIRQSLNLDVILQTTVTEVRNFLQTDRVVIHKLQQDHEFLILQESVHYDFPSMINQTLSIDHIDQYCQGECLAYANIEKAELSSHYQNFLRQFNVQANIIVPIFIQNNLWGLLVAHQCQHPRNWTNFEMELLRELANQISIALSQAQLLENLEEMVLERTTKLTQTNVQLQQEIFERQQVEEALRNSREELRLITNALPILIAYIDNQKCYLFNNQAYQDWFGRNPQELHQKSMEEVWDSRTYQTMCPAIDTVLSGEKVSYETSFITLEGTIRHFSATYIPHVGEKEEVKGFFSIVIDISERKEIEKMKDELVSVASHELRTPLTSIRGSLGLLGTGKLGSLSPQGKRMLDIAVRNTERLSFLINDILDLERIESGKVKMEKQLCDAAFLAFQAVQTMQVMAKQNDLILEIYLHKNNRQETICFEERCQPPALEITLVADPDHILQTLINLISNAIKFSPPEGKISLTIEHQGQNIFFQVQDQGRGIPANKLESIFERFKQVDASDSREKGGTGLGLAICRQIVELHEGKIWVNSALGQGSCFCFTLPVE